jgi:hypothetical protein
MSRQQEPAMYWLFRRLAMIPLEADHQLLIDGGWLLFIRLFTHAMIDAIVHRTP